MSHHYEILFAIFTNNSNKNINFSENYLTYISNIEYTTILSVNNN